MMIIDSTTNSAIRHLRIDHSIRRTPRYSEGLVQRSAHTARDMNGTSIDTNPLGRVWRAHIAPKRSHLFSPFPGLILAFLLQWQVLQACDADPTWHNTEDHLGTVREGALNGLSYINNDPRPFQYLKTRIGKYWRSLHMFKFFFICHGVISPLSRSFLRCGGGAGVVHPSPCGGGLCTRRRGAAGPRSTETGICPLVFYDSVLKHNPLLIDIHVRTNIHIYRHMHEWWGPLLDPPESCRTPSNGDRY